MSKSNKEFIARLKNGEYNVYYVDNDGVTYQCFYKKAKKQILLQEVDHEAHSLTIAFKFIDMILASEKICKIQNTDNSEYNLLDFYLDFDIITNSEYNKIKVEIASI